MEDLMFELKRKIVHIGTIVFLIAYYFIELYFSKRTALFTLILALVALSLLEFIQIKFSVKIPLFYRLYRKNERYVFSGSIYLLIGMIISLAVFDFNIAATAILMMVFGDSASAIIGRMGKHRIPGIKVSLEGIIAEFIVDLAVGFIFLNNIPVILFMAIAATLVESLLAPIDDNLAVPLVAGFAGQTLMYLMKIFGA